jgi:hypothetical protein
VTNLFKFEANADEMIHDWSQDWQETPFYQNIDDNGNKIITDWQDWNNWVVTIL